MEIGDREDKADEQQIIIPLKEAPEHPYIRSSHINNFKPSPNPQKLEK